MRAEDLRLGQTYDCVFDGDQGREKSCIAPLAVDAAKRFQFILVEPRRVQTKSPAFFKRLLAMSYQEILDEDLPGSPDREWSAYVWQMEITESGDLYREDFDLYIADLVESGPDTPKS